MVVVGEQCAACNSVHKREKWRKLVENKSEELYNGLGMWHARKR